MTDDEVALVRRLRVDEGNTWRGVSEDFLAAVGDDPRWSDVACDQFEGMLLCEAAAVRLGDDPSAAPWN
jgi:hypothetical protein